MVTPLRLRLRISPVSSKGRSSERPQATDCEGALAWTGDGGRTLDARVNAEIDQGCERIRKSECTVITPAMREIEAADPDRELVGLNHRLKSEDRLKEKVADVLDSRPGLTASQALTGIADAIRFTFCYTDDRYAKGVLADMDRLRDYGFELVKAVKNSWASDQYKGINSQWRELGTGQRFEVQFHTWASFETKQHTHAAYERIRSPETSPGERERLERVPAPSQHEDPDPARRGRYQRSTTRGTQWLNRLPTTHLSMITAPTMNPEVWFGV